jgi:hypothetical protein
VTDTQKAAKKELCPDCGGTFTVVGWPPECFECGVTLWGREYPSGKKYDVCDPYKCWHLCAECHKKGVKWDD